MSLDSKTEHVVTTTTKFKIDDLLQLTYTHEVKDGKSKRTVTIAQHTAFGGYVYLDESQLSKLITALKGLQDMP